MREECWCAERNCTLKKSETTPQFDVAQEINKKEKYPKDVTKL